MVDSSHRVCANDGNVSPYYNIARLRAQEKIVSACGEVGGFLSWKRGERLRSETRLRAQARYKEKENVERPS